MIKNINNSKFLYGMKKLLKLFSPIFTYFILSSTAFAATATSGCNMTGMTTLKDIIVKFITGCILSNVIYILSAFSVVIFIWGVFKFSTAEGEEKQSGKSLMIWGIVGIFVILSIGGLIAILQNTFHLGGDFNITPRQVNLGL
ncbi:MAG: hypothetical protein WC933_00645 [Candidatus Paceibacterota bacterium]|jgi:hypothetical protein